MTYALLESNRQVEFVEKLGEKKKKPEAVVEVVVAGGGKSGEKH